tara:strand:+ start:318 stop:545 length:228 start_codon:yes stop_codon:yes gene_type:complete
MLKYLERWLPALTIRRASLFSERLEDSTGWSLDIVDHEGELLFFLIDPYGDQEEDSWNNLDDCISDLSYYMGVAV